MPVNTKFFNTRPHLTAVTTSSRLNMFTQMDHVGGFYTRNPNLWATTFTSSLDYTAISVWNSNRNSGQYGVTAVSTDDVIMCAHAGMNVGNRVRFVTNDNQVIERTLTVVQSHPSYSSSPVYHHDLKMGKLDRPLPPTITPMLILPESFLIERGWDRTGSISPPIPTYIPNQSNQLMAYIISMGQSIYSLRIKYSMDWYYVDRSPYTKSIIPGDSGHACYAVEEISGSQQNVFICPLTTTTHGTYAGGDATYEWVYNRMNI